MMRGDLMDMTAGAPALALALPGSMKLPPLPEQVAAGLASPTAPTPTPTVRPCMDVTTDYQPWEVSFRGLRWCHMPGGCVVSQKLNFALFRRGLLTIAEMKAEERRAEQEARVAKVKTRNPLQERCDQEELATLVAQLEPEIKKTGLAQKFVLRKYDLHESVLTPKHLARATMYHFLKLQRMLKLMRGEFVAPEDVEDGEEPEGDEDDEDEV